VAAQGDRLVGAALLALLALPAAAQTEHSEEHSFRVVALTRGLEQPWSLAFLPDGRMLVTEKAGRLRFVGKDYKLDPQPIAGLPQATLHGQGGRCTRALRRTGSFTCPMRRAARGA
jgi:glucose/arabinose dehydrogenase